MTLTLQKPRRLREGDKVASISLSWGGPGAIPPRYQAGKRQFEQEFGIRVVETPNALRPADWLAANPKARAEDLMGAFADPMISGIISTIGGDDSVRILPFLDESVIRQNPKVFMGYSDSTATHLACFKAGLVSFYGPSFMSGFGENAGMFPYMIDSVRRSVFSTLPIGVIKPNRDGWTVEYLNWADPANQMRKRKLTPASGWRFLQGRGAVSGPLIGGCTEVLEFLKGTPWWPPIDAWDGAILFLENSEEAPTPVAFKRWIRNYGSQGILQRLSGILVGRPGGGIHPDLFSKYDEVLIEVVRDELGLESLPVVTQMDFGHTDPMFVLPYGVNGAIDCDGVNFRIDESAVM